MLLKRLEAVGFKSFATRTSVELVSGISVVVGPNGSGKSNIADSVRWVLGEQSARAVRARKPEEVIFAGSMGRQPLGMAEVSLVFDNADGALPIDFSEVKVSRRLYRSGESEYLLNNARVRLRDITHHLLHVGLGSDSYCVIGQGSVDELILQRPDERRVIFENAADIRRHQLKLNDTRSKLQATQVNLTRVEDVIAELAPHVRRLKGQADRAARSASMATELGQLATRYYRLRWREVRCELAEAEQTLASTERTLAQAVERTASAEAGLTSSEKLVAALELRLATERPRVEALRERARMAGQSLAVTRERLAALAEAERATGASLAENEAHVARLDREIAGRQAALLDLADVANPDPALRDHARERMASLEARLASGEQELRLQRAARDTAEQAILTAERELSGAEIRLGEIEASGALERARQGEARARLAAVQTQVTRLTGLVSEGEQRLAAARLAAEITRTTLDGTRSEEHRRAEKLRELRQQVDRLQGALDALGLAPRGGADAALPAQWREVLANLPVVGLAGDLAGRVRPLDVLLRGYLQRIVVVRTDDAAREARSRLAGLLSAGGPAWAVLSLDGRLFAAPGDQPVEADEGQGSALVSWRERVVELEAERTTLEVAAAAAEEAARAAAAVLAGAERQADRAGVELRTAEESLDAASRQLTSARAEDSKLTTELRRALQQASAADELGQATAAQCVDARERLAQARQAREQAARALAAQEHALAAIREEAGAARARLDQLDRAEAQRLAERRSAEQLVERAGAERRQAVAGQVELRHRVDELRRQTVALREREQVLVQEESTLRDELDPLLTDLAAAESERLRLIQERHRLEAAAHAVRVAERAEHERRERVLPRAQRARDELDRLRQEVEDLAETEGSDRQAVEGDWTHQLQLALTETSEAAHVPVDLPEAPPAELAEMRRRLAALRRELRLAGGAGGAVVEEFRDLSDRHTFLSQQASDLGAGMAELRSAAAELEAHMRERFAGVFEAVNLAFQACFQTLFDGGEARLVLTQPDNVLDSGVEIMARPPGKKLQGLLSLSGGERALTIVALLFGLLKVNPTPFCVLDEVDAALDEANVRRFADLLRELSSTIQFIVVTHNRATMEIADAMYGVTMDQEGVSRILSVKPRLAATA